MSNIVRPNNNNNNNNNNNKKNNIDDDVGDDGDDDISVIRPSHDRAVMHSATITSIVILRFQHQNVPKLNLKNSTIFDF